METGFSLIDFDVIFPMQSSEFKKSIFFEKWIWKKWLKFFSSNFLS